MSDQSDIKMCALTNKSTLARKEADIFLEILKTNFDAMVKAVTDFPDTARNESREQRGLAALRLAAIGMAMYAEYVSHAAELFGSEQSLLSVAKLESFNNFTKDIVSKLKQLTDN